MKKNLGGLCLLMTLAISLLAPRLNANQSAATTRTVTVPANSAAKQVTMEGTVQSLASKSDSGSLLDAHLMVSTAQGTVDASIGHFWGAGPYATLFASGQSIKLVGVMREFDNHSILLVHTLQIGNRTITVRNEHGFLVNPGARTRLAGVASTGGVR